MSRIEQVSAPESEDDVFDDDLDAALSDDTDGAGVADEEDVEEEPVAPAIRRREPAPGHRQPKPRAVVTNPGPSSWERPREGFTASMEARVPEMRATREASFVKGTSREA